MAGGARGAAAGHEDWVRSVAFSPVRVRVDKKRINKVRVVPTMFLHHRRITALTAADDVVGALNVDAGNPRRS